MGGDTIILGRGYAIEERGGSAIMNALLDECAVPALVDIFSVTKYRDQCRSFGWWDLSDLRQNEWNDVLRAARGLDAYTSQCFDFWPVANRSFLAHSLARFCKAVEDRSGISDDAPRTPHHIPEGPIALIDDEYLPVETWACVPKADSQQDAAPLIHEVTKYMLNPAKWAEQILAQLKDLQLCGVITRRWRNGHFHTDFGAYRSDHFGADWVRKLCTEHPCSRDIALAVSNGLLRLGSLLMEAPFDARSTPGRIDARCHVWLAAFQIREWLTAQGGVDMEQIDWKGASHQLQHHRWEIRARALDQLRASGVRTVLIGF